MLTPGSRYQRCWCQPGGNATESSTGTAIPLSWTPPRSWNRACSVGVTATTSGVARTRIWTWTKTPPVSCSSPPAPPASPRPGSRPTGRGRRWSTTTCTTEQGAITTRLLPTEVGERRERLQSVGRPGAPFFEVAIFDDNGKRLGPGQVGEIAVRSAMSIGEYWALPDKTREAFFPGDWFRPYDVGYLDEDGFLYY